MKVMSFNVRGLGKRIKRNEIRSLIRSNGIEMCCIQETKMEKIDIRLGRELWGDKDCEWVYREAEGRSGGLISIWNTKVFSKTSSWHVSGMLVVNGRWIDGDVDMVIINVYAPCSILEKEQLLEAIKFVVEQYDDRKICVVGDFNSIIEVNERFGRWEKVNHRDINLFEDFISRVG
ncbi:hypothetical protein ACS0TY_018376 [Phlomoides rotata]